MIVKELIEHLSKLDPELQIYTATDPEGNGYNRLDYEPGICLIEENLVGDYYLESVYTEEDWASEQADGYIDEDAVPAKVVII